MANFITRFSENEDNYSDGSVEDRLLDYVKASKSEEEILEIDNSWPMFYHLSYLRENILNWYPFNENSDILEIGAGCGAITGLLCKKAKSVTAVELTKRRAEINYNRHKDCDNLTIYVADLFKIDLNQKFDYITVIGVFEYAALMSKADNPYTDFLEKIKQFLKPDGHILIAIENRIGLKYFSGAREDHTSKFFDGINGYKDGGFVRTFTKKELTELLDKSDLQGKRFYYPLPDYKFPTSIYTDETINSFDEDMYIWAYDNQRFRLFDENNVMITMANEKVLDEFSNSFLVDCTKRENNINFSTQLVKISSLRKNKYRIATIVTKEDRFNAYKIALNDEAVDHLRNMKQFYDKTNEYHGLKCVKADKLTGNSLSFDFAEGLTLAYIIKERYNSQGIVGIYKYLDLYKDIVSQSAEYVENVYTAEFEDYFGKQYGKKGFMSIRPANIDLGFNHIFIQEDGTKILIDYEWIVDFFVPVDFLLWRALNYFYFKDMSFDDKNKMYLRYNITSEQMKLFSKWESYLLSKKVGTNPRGDFNSCSLDLNEIEYCKWQSKYSTIYIDNGRGFNSNDMVMFKNLELDKVRTIKYHVSDKVNLLRFDPIEEIASQVKILSARFNGAPIEINPLNADISSVGIDYFLTKDPAYIISTSGVEGELEICYKVSKLDTSKLEIKLTDKINSLNNEINSVKNDNQELHQNIDNLTKSLSWRMTSPMRKISKTLKSH